MEKDKEIKQERIIGMFVINDKNEMLVCKQVTGSFLQHNAWQAPYLSYNDTANSAIARAEQYLQDIGFDGELHEAFTLYPAIPTTPSQPLHCEHIIIALTRTGSQEPTLMSCTSKWIALKKLMCDIHEQPTNYTPWFKSALEGVTLFLKRTTSRAIDDQQPFTN